MNLLATQIKNYVDLDALYILAETAKPPQPPSSSQVPTLLDISKRTRLGVAYDEAFFFYYHDHWRLLRNAGVELVSFSPLNEAHLPSDLDGIYIGGGYPELHAADLQKNESMRHEIASFVHAGGIVYAECGGLMYLSEKIWTKERRCFDMCQVLPLQVTMTPNLKLLYAELSPTSTNPFFWEGRRVRAQEFHFSEVVQTEKEGFGATSTPFVASPQRGAAQPQPSFPVGYQVNNCVASYFHQHWGSEPAVANDFVQSMLRKREQRQSSDIRAVSFVSAATEIAFALKSPSDYSSVADELLMGVTSVCDTPSRARLSPRRVVSRSPFDASTMTSEEVAAAVKEATQQTEPAKKGGPPGYWKIDMAALREIRPTVAFVQETCDICDTSNSDVRHALEQLSADSAPCRVVCVAPTRLEEMFECVATVAKELGVMKAGENLVQQLRGRLAAIKARLSGKKPLKVISLDGLYPLCVGGGWLPDVKEAAGCVDALGDVGGCAPHHVTWGEILQNDPDALIISPCSGRPTRTLNELHLLQSREFWQLRCVRTGQVYVLDHGFFSRPGPRLVEGVELLASLLHGIPPPEGAQWQELVYKYECCVGKVKHCTTELSSRFKECYPAIEPSTAESLTAKYTATKPIPTRHCSQPNTQQREMQLAIPRRIRVTRCSVPGNHLPIHRSAHNLLTMPNGSLLLFGGEGADGRRYDDVWVLHRPKHGWTCSGIADFASGKVPLLGHSPVWERMACSHVADENVPTPRSNSAAVICGKILLVFGGWDQNSRCIDHCDLLHLDSWCWTHCSTKSEVQPSARGNPTLVFSEFKNLVILFGGWNGQDRLSDLWTLDMNTWTWREVKRKEPWPPARTDHASVLWKQEEGKETMVVFGGTVAGPGQSNDTWLWDLQTLQWTLMTKASDQSPKPRTSHCCVLVSQGEGARLLVAGGTDVGSGSSNLTADAWVCFLKQQLWVPLQWAPSDGILRCRHSMVLADQSSIVWWGGYDGDTVVDEKASVWISHIEQRVKASGCDTGQRIEHSSNTDRNIQIQEVWQAEIPIRESDLPEDVLAKARDSPLPNALAKALHRHALSQKRHTYIDPSSGYSVFTCFYLKKRPCCGNGCRHCPHGHKNVVKETGKVESLDW